MELLLFVTEAFLSAMKLVFVWKYMSGQKIAFHEIWRERWLYILFAGLTGVFLLLFCAAEIKPGMFQYIDFFATVMLLAVVDFRYKIIPDSILLCFMLNQLFYSIWNVPLELMGRNLIAAVVIFGIAAMVSLLSKGRLGFGDAKLLGIMAGFAGPGYLFQTVFFGMIAAFLFSLAALLLKKVTMKTEFPFVPFIVVGMAAQLLIGR